MGTSCRVCWIRTGGNEIEAKGRWLLVKGRFKGATKWKRKEKRKKKDILGKGKAWLLVI